MCRKNRVLPIFMSLVLIVLLTCSSWAAEVVILFTNDVHGRLESYISGESGELGGRVRLATVIEQIRAQYGPRNVLLLDAGDSISGANPDNLFAGRPSTEVMNALRYDAFTLGNHEFDFGQESLLEIIGNSRFATLAGNVTSKEGRLFGGYSALIQEINGVRVGVIGLVTCETPIVTHPKNVAGLVFHDPISLTRRLAKRLRPKVDVLAALTHTGYDVDLELARAVPELDIIIGGHDHIQLITPTIVDDVWILQTGEYGDNLGFLRLVVDEHRLVHREYRLIAVTEEVAKNREIEEIVEHWNMLLVEYLDQVIGETETSWNGERSIIRTRETNLGNLIADIMREAVEADLALTNAGGIRAGINAGKVTAAHIYDVLPFDNTLALIELQGWQIVEALEHGARLLPEENGGFLQVSGLSFGIDLSASPGRRICEVAVNGIPLSPFDVYLVATNDFLAAGGDGYDVFQGGQLLVDTGIALRDLVLHFLENNPVIAVPEGGRVFIIE